ncbi:MAG: ferric reductase-like transmembrane domain-containing protein [Actinomycetia bacterium]|nr:ferric reductase-like transmembrane domain-containing protein [Actinomycetes bacterium]
MTDTQWWYITRATGIVATVLAVAALVFGFFFSSRNTGERRRPAWWLDLHNWLGGTTLVFTVVHIVASYLDRNSGIGLLQVLVPGTAKNASWAITWGVIATYTFAITVFTSWPRKRLRPRLWRLVHLTSVVGVALAGLHAFQVGIDATTLAFEAGLAITAALAVYALGVRVLALLVNRTHQG